MPRESVLGEDAVEERIAAAIVVSRLGRELHLEADPRCAPAGESAHLPAEASAGLKPPGPHSVAARAQRQLAAEGIRPAQPSGRTRAARASVRRPSRERPRARQRRAAGSKNTGSMRAGTTTHDPTASPGGGGKILVPGRAQPLSLSCAPGPRLACLARANMRLRHLDEGVTLIPAHDRKRRLERQLERVTGGSRWHSREMKSSGRRSRSHSGLTVRAAAALIEMLEHPERRAGWCQEISDLEHQGDKITHDTVLALHQTWITPLDREEIHGLISRARRRARLHRAAADRIALYEISEARPEAVELAKILQLSCQRDRARPWRMLHEHEGREAAARAVRRRSTATSTTPTRSSGARWRACSTSAPTRSSS